MKHTYAIIRENNPQTFANQVNAAIADGWMPLGGVAMTQEEHIEAGDSVKETIYAQALVRRGVNGVDIAT